MNNYGELVTAVTQYLYDRKDLEPIIPTFVALSERRIYRLLRCPANEAIYASAQMEGDAFTLPRDYLECKILTANDQQLARMSDQEYLACNQGKTKGNPSGFARFGSEFKIWPPPDEPKDISMIYWQDLSGQLTTNDATNDILRIAPDLYVYGAMIEAMPYLAQDDRTETWNSLFDQAMAQINAQAVESEFSGSSVAVGEPYSDSRNHYWGH